MAGEMLQLAKTKIGQAISEGNIKGLKKCLEQGQDPLFKDRKDNTYLHYVCTMHRPHIIHILFTTPIDINTQNRHGNTPLHVTALQNECCHVADLMAAGADPSVRNKEGKTASELKTKNKYWQSIYNKYQPGIFQAVSDHNVERVLELLHCWSMVDSLRNGQTLRQFAAALKFHDIVFLLDDHKPTLDAIYGVLEVNKVKVKAALKKSKCNINYVNHASTRRHILQYAISLHDTDLVTLICNAGADVNLPVLVNSYYWGPLYFEAINSNLPAEIIWKVLKNKANFSLKDERGRNCMMFALDKTNGAMPLDVIAYMLKQGAYIAERDETGSTVRDVARFARRRDVVNLIDKFYVRILRESDLETLRKLSVDGYDSLLIQHNYRDTYIYACGNETDDVLKFTNWLPEFQKNVILIHKHIRNSDKSMVEKLLTDTEKSPDMLVNARDKGGRSSLHLAVLFENFDIAKYLMSMPAIDINVKDCHLRSVYHYACSVPGAEGIRLALIQRGVDMEAVDTCWKTGEDYRSVKGEVPAWVATCRMAKFSMALELQCVDKYEELRRIVKNKRKGLTEFTDAMKHFKAHPVVDFPKLLAPLMPDYKDLIFLALEHNKPEIAERLANLGADLTQTEVYVIDFEPETESEDDESNVGSNGRPPVSAEIVMTPADRARFLGLSSLAERLDKKREWQLRDKGNSHPTVIEQLNQQFPSIFVTQMF
ncbi:putative ankyrin repeat protein RF_0381 isoform X1 [Haliotis asinina]|uniref:putative ankyrin repeat protein RF_0381 isoform X1 n=1 Tax=Haliotis asinina TaxID=109174 RepID=UPI0035321E23